MQVTATEPVIAEKDGEPDFGLAGCGDFRAMKAAPTKKSMAQRKKEFNEKYKDWIDEQHRIVEEIGVFGEECRGW